MDTEGELRVKKENLIEYFSQPNFLDVDAAEEIKKQEEDVSFFGESTA